MKTNILLLIAVMVIFSGCSRDEVGSCEYGFLDKDKKCTYTVGEDECAEKAGYVFYNFTPGGSCK